MAFGFSVTRLQAPPHRCGDRAPMTGSLGAVRVAMAPPQTESDSGPLSAIITTVTSFAGLTLLPGILRQGTTHFS